MRTDAHLSVDISAFCWTLGRNESHRLHILFHTAPGLAPALCRALPDSLGADVLAPSRVRCRRREGVAAFLRAQGAPETLLELYCGPGLAGRQEAVRGLVGWWKTGRGERGVPE